MNKIVVTEGCICYGITCDDKDLREYQTEDIYNIAERCLTTLNKDDLVRFIWDYATQHGDWNSLGECDECGDSIDEWTIEI